MARKNSTVISDEELDSALGESQSRSRLAEESPLDARMLDLDEEAASPFLRGQKRVPVRRGPLPLPPSAAGRVKTVLICVAVAVTVVAVWMTLERYGTQSWRFRLDSSDNISISGTNTVSRQEVLDVLASDIDRNVFFIPLEVRKTQLESIPWVKSAAVMRLLPNRLRVDVTERTPIAFVEMNSKIQLIDSTGVIMELPSNQSAKYSFPVIVGISDSDPLSTRAARMKIYSRFIKDLDAGGAHYSADISDVDVSDPDDVTATVTDQKGAVLVHLGSRNFLEHFKTYVSHIQEWRTQFPNLQSVNLRYDHQVIVDPQSSAIQASTRPAQSMNAISAGADPTGDHQEHKKAGPIKKNKKHA